MLINAIRHYIYLREIGRNHQVARVNTLLTYAPTIKEYYNHLDKVNGWKSN